MGASSATGKGNGASNKPGIVQLQEFSNSVILAAGYAEGSEVVASPPGFNNLVEFDVPLEGPSDRYVVMVTTLNGGYAYVSTMQENDDGNFYRFGVVVEADCNFMYLVAKVK